MTTTLDAYLSLHPELVLYAPFMHPDRARALGFANPFLIFPRGFFEDHNAYDQECQRNMHDNQVKLKSLGLTQGNTDAFLHGVVWDVTDRRVEAAKAREVKKAETQKRREEQRMLKKAERQEQLKEKRRARRAAVVAKKNMADIDDLPDPMAVLNLHDTVCDIPWCRDIPPIGLMTYPGTKDPVLVQHLPETVVDALMDIVDEILTRYGDQDPDTGEQMYVHVGRYRARYGSAVFSGWQVQRRIAGASTVTYLGRTWESILGALVAAASYMDARITSLASAHSWILWLVEGGEPTATVWLTSVRYALENWRANIKIRTPNAGRRLSP